LEEKKNMKKRWSIIAFMLVLIPILSTTCIANQGTVLQIEAIDDSYLLGVASVIENVGDVAAEDIEWSITFEGGTVFMPIGGVRNGVCKNISPGERKNIFSGPVFGFGLLTPMEITVSARASNADPVQKTEVGWMFLFIVRV
jgi:hypothetical protein